MHSDGDIRELAEDLLEIGIDVLNIQDLVNGIDWIAANLKGHVAIELDIDRQKITRFGTPREIHRHVREAVSKLAEPEGGLMLKHSMRPGVPLENAAALMDVMEECSVKFGSPS
jgi:uroporphyrinogen-III decarboxylase